jgi:hypothetical protein
MSEQEFEADRDEAKFGKPPTTPASDTTHECDSGDFDRTICACGVMHSYCWTCGERQDKCSAADTPMTAPDTDRLTETLPVIVKVLTDEGGAPGNSLHSWRCEYPDRYGECDCLTGTAESILAALRPTIDALLTEQAEHIAAEVRPVAADAARSAFDDDPERLSASLTRVGNNLARIARQEASR